MGTLISIPAQDKRGAHRDPNEFMQVPRGEWLALVETAEAARTLVHSLLAGSPGWLHNENGERLIDALSRFDFGEQAR